MTKDNLSAERESNNKNDETLKQYQIDLLFHITKISNLKSIFTYGLLSHQKAHNRFNRHIFGITVADISDTYVQDRRKYKLVNDKSIHEYVCLYLNPKNPMLFSRKDQQAELVILGISPLLLLEEEVYFSDGNAAALDTNFYKDLQSLALINWKALRSQEWSDQPDRKRVKCSEVLVPFTVTRDRIQKIFCYNTKQVQTIELILQELKQERELDISLSLEVKRDLYF